MLQIRTAVAVSACYFFFHSRRANGIICDLIAVELDNPSARGRLGITDTKLHKLSETQHKSTTSPKGGGFIGGGPREVERHKLLAKLRIEVPVTEHPQQKLVKPARGRRGEHASERVQV